MLGTRLQFNGVRGEDRFYIPVKARKNQTQKQRKQQQRESAQNSNSPSQKSRDLACQNQRSSLKDDTFSTAVLGSEAGRVRVSLSNLERFLDSTTPSVPALCLSKTTMRGWRTCDVEYHPYFTLGDLWESFKEWSAYGAGVPLVLDGSDFVVQYYVPYLSGIQLYCESRSLSDKRLPGEESHGDYYRDSSSSDRSSDYELEKGIKYVRGQFVHGSVTNNVPFEVGRLSLSGENTREEGFSSDESEIGSSQGQLLFEFLEQDTPYSREPLADKILDLAGHYPMLRKLRSCDLLPTSWISVAWYPIYRIPTGPTLKDLDACFLTYHSLSTPMEGTGSGQAPIIVDGVPKISLPVFGMASYKFKGSMWTHTGVSESQLANSLTQAAENRLRLLRVSHPDFQFFASHGMYQR